MNQSCWCALLCCCALARRKHVSSSPQESCAHARAPGSARRHVVSRGSSPVRDERLSPAERGVHIDVSRAAVHAAENRSALASAALRHRASGFRAAPAKRPDGHPAPASRCTLAGYARNGGPAIQLQRRRSGNTSTWFLAAAVRRSGETCCSQDAHTSAQTGSPCSRSGAWRRAAARAHLQRRTDAPRLPSAPPHITQMRQGGGETGCHQCLRRLCSHQHGRPPSPLPSPARRQPAIAH